MPFIKSTLKNKTQLEKKKKKKIAAGWLIGKQDETVTNKCLHRPLGIAGN